MLLAPHHDGSSLYVDDLTPSLGSEVTVRLRIPHAQHAADVWVRVVTDREPRWVQAKLDRSDAWESWWYARVRVHNPVTRYRWRLTGPDRWVNQLGVLTHDPTDANDFRLVAHAAPPPWASDAVFYQIFPDRFARSEGADAWQRFPDWAIRSAWDDPVIEPMPGAMTQLFGGDFGGVAERLDHLVALGINAIYATPFFPGRSNHRYDASTFDHVDPVLGGDAGLARLTSELHRRGIRFLGDLTTNHSGVSHTWFATAQADPASEEAEFYTFRSHPDDYEAWLGVRSLPKLNHASEALSRRLIDGDDSIVARYLRPPFDLDGWRIDVANMTGRLGSEDRNHEVAKRLRAALRSARADDGLLIAEHCHDATDDLDGDGWYATMNYSGFTNPVWSWLAAWELPRFFGGPSPLHRRPGGDVRRSIDEFAAAISWRSRTANLNLLDSHDSVRFRSIVGDDARLQSIGTTMLLTFPGIPSIFQGDELGMSGRHTHVTRAPLPWNRPDTWDRGTLAHTTAAVQLRRNAAALREGGFRWVSAGDDHLAYLRETADDRILVVANRTDAPCGSAVTSALAALGIGEQAEVELLLGAGGSGSLGMQRERFDAAGATVLRLPA